MGKYLDETGLKHLWGKIKAEDAANQLTTNTALAQKGGYIEYDETDQYIKLWASEADSKAEGKTPLCQFSAAAFIKDGMLDDVDIATSSESLPIKYGDVTYKDGTKFIGFTWNTDAGTKTDYLKIDEIGKTYGEGDGINISDDNKISVTNVASAKVTNQAIPVEGGPLADMLKAAGITEISTDTDLASLLMSFVCKELWPTKSDLSTVNGSLSVSIVAPSFTLSNSGTTVEVGTKCTLSEVTVSEGAKVSSSVAPKVTGFAHGYADADDNQKDSSASEISATVKTAATVQSTNYTLGIDYTNFYTTSGSAATDNSSASVDADIANISYDSQTLVARPGTNTVKATISGPKATVVYNEIPSVYAVSNLGNTHDKEGNVYCKSDAVTSSNILNISSSNASNSASLSVTGKYKYFFGYSDIKSIHTVAEYFDSAKVRALTTQTGDLENSGTKTLNAGTSNGKSLVVAFPNTYKLSDAKYTDGSDMMANFSMSGTVDVACANNADYTTPYTVMVFPVDAFAEVGFKDIKITKK